MLSPLRLVVLCLLGGGLGGDQIATVPSCAPEHPMLIEAEPCPFEMPILLADNDDLDDEDEADDDLLRPARSSAARSVSCVVFVATPAADIAFEPAFLLTPTARLRALQRLLI